MQERKLTFPARYGIPKEKDGCHAELNQYSHWKTTEKTHRMEDVSFHFPDTGFISIQEMTNR